jgi:hypothetical protein
VKALRVGNPMSNRALPLAPALTDRTLASSNADRTTRRIAITKQAPLRPLQPAGCGSVNSVSKIVGAVDERRYRSLDGSLYRAVDRLCMIGIATASWAHAHCRSYPASLRRHSENRRRTSRGCDDRGVASARARNCRERDQHHRTFHPAPCGSAVTLGRRSRRFGFGANGSTLT